MKQHLTTFAHDLDTLCAKLNEGLTVVAVLLGCLVLGMLVIRAEDITADPSGLTPAFSQVASGQHQNPPYCLAQALRQKHINLALRRVRFSSDCLA